MGIRQKGDKITFFKSFPRTEGQTFDLNVEDIPTIIEFLQEVQESKTA